MDDLAFSVAEKKIKKTLSVLVGILVVLAFVLTNSLYPDILFKDLSKFQKYFLGATSTASVDVGNSEPAASSASLNGESTITLTEGTTTPVVVTGAVTDYNGCLDLASVVIKVYTGLLSNCTVTNNTTCYITTISSPSTDPSCTGGTDTSFALSSSNATLNLQYYAQPATWNVTIIPTDITNDGGQTTDTSTGTVLATTTGLTVSSTITYGSVANGANSTGDHTATVTNTGNAAIDYRLSGAAPTLDCTANGGLGSIPIENEEYSTASFSHGSGTALTTSPATVTANIVAQTTASPVTADSYWQIAVPYGVRGTCSGSVVFTAVAH